MVKNSFFLFQLLLVLALVGCGNNASLKGKVLFSDDKSPVPTGTVCFEKDNFLARGILKPDGTYVVSSLKQGDGLPPGTYRVYISDADKPIGEDSGGTTIYESLIDEKFANVNTSGITIDVTPSTKSFEFEVDRYVRKKR